MMYKCKDENSHTAAGPRPTQCATGHREGRGCTHSKAGRVKIKFIVKE